jgi:hypothetical protein
MPPAGASQPYHPLELFLQEMRGEHEPQEDHRSQLEDVQNS